MDGDASPPNTSKCFDPQLDLPKAQPNEAFSPFFLPRLLLVVNFIKTLSPTDLEM